MLVNIYMKFHEGILNGFQVTKWTQFCDGQTDYPGKNNMTSNPKVGRHNRAMYSKGLQIIILLFDKNGEISGTDVS